MRKITLLLFAMCLTVISWAQNIPESNAQPFYGVRHFVSMDGADTLSVSYEDGRVNFRTTDSVIVHKLDYAAFFSGLYGDTVTYSFPYNDTISIGAGRVRLHDNDTFKGALMEYDLAPANLYIAPDELTYVVANFNNGNPVYSTTTNVGDISESDVVPVYTVYRQNGNAYIQGWYDLGEGLANKLHQRHVFIQRVERQSGLDIDTLNTLNVQLSAGVVWRGGQQNFLDEFNSLDDSLYFYSYDGTDWNYATTEEVNRTNYQTPTGLATTSNNNYVVNWLFRGIGTGPAMFYVVGTENYNKLEAAEASQIPADLPNIITKFAFPVGRIIIEKGATTVTEINSYFDRAFTSALPTEHNNLTGIQGGTPGQYYHLTSAQVTKLNGIEEGAEVNVNADWDATTGDAEILNKPDFIEFSDTSSTIATKYDLDTLSNQPTVYTFRHGLTEIGGTVDLGDDKIEETTELLYEGENTRHYVGAYDTIANPRDRSFMYVEDDKFYAESGDVIDSDYSYMEMTPAQTSITTVTGTDQTTLRVEPYEIELIADSKVKINNKLNVSGQTTYPDGLEGDVIRLNSHTSDPDGMYLHDGSDFKKLLDADDVNLSSLWKSFGVSGVYRAHTQVGIGGPTTRDFEVFGGMFGDQLQIDNENTGSFAARFNSTTTTDRINIAQIANLSYVLEMRDSEGNDDLLLTSDGYGYFADFISVNTKDQVADINASNGNSDEWGTAYTHSQINTGNPHDLDLSDIGESLSSINYWTKSGDDLSYSGGNVAINKTSADYTIDVNGTGRFVGDLSLNSNLFIGSNRLYQSSDDLILNYNIGGNFRYYGGTTSEKFMVATNGDITNSGNITASGSVAAGTFFKSNSTNVVLGTNSAGTVYLRPNGEQSATNQTVINSSGDMTVGGDIIASGEVTANTNFKSSDAVVVLGTSAGSAGSVYLRPNGYNSTTNQTEINSSGDMTVGGDITTSYDMAMSGDLYYKGAGTFIIAHNNSDGDNTLIRPSGVNSTVGQIIISPGGGMSVPGNITADNFILSSDSTLKENISPLYNDNEIVSFNFKKDTTNRTRYGVIAQELQKTHPEMVHMNQDSTFGVAYTDYLVYKVAELQNQINQLKQGGQKDENTALPYANFALIISTIIFFASTRHRNV